MRLAHPLSRLLASLGFMLAVCALLLAPRAGTPALAQPIYQAATPVLTPVLNEQQSLPGQTVVYTLTLRNAGATTDSFTVEFDPTYPGPTIPGATASFSSAGPFQLTSGNTISVNVLVGIPSTATVGLVDARRVIARSVSNQSLTATAIVRTTVVAATPTATATTTTTTPTTTGTAGPVCRDGAEPNGTPSQAKEIRPDQTQTHAICPKGDEDFTYFGGIAGKVYTIEVANMTAGLDLSLSLYDAAGNLLAFNNDFPRNNDPFDIKPRIQSWRAPDNGQYYIKVRDDAGRGDTGLTYTIELQSEAYGPTPTQVNELCNDLFEPDGVPQQARLLVIREVQPNHKFCPAGDADWVRFFAKANENYVLRTDSRSRAGADPVMILVDRDGASILDFNDDTGNTLDSRIEFTVPVDGFYYAQLKNVGDIGNQFIAYDLAFEPSGAPAAQPTTGAATPTLTATGSPTVTGTPGTPTTTGTPGTGISATQTAIGATQTAAAAYPGPTQTVVAQTATSIAQTITAIATQTASAQDLSISGVKGAPDFVDGRVTGFVDPALQSVWARTDQVVAARQVDRSWMWGPAGLVARAETYSQSNGGARQVQYFDKARMEITDWSRDRSNPWFVTNGLLVKELVDGRLQIGDAEFLDRTPAQITIAGDADDRNGPTYASFAQHTAPAGNRVGQTATATLRRDGSTGTTAANPAAKLVVHVPETGHNIPQVFWDFLNASGPVGDGKQSGPLVDWVFAMGYPISEPYWTKVKVGGVEKDVLVQAFQRRVLTYTPGNPQGWQVEMGNVGRHYYLWRYSREP